MAYYKASKYKAQKTVVDGITFDSKKEATHYQHLVVKQKCGEISELQTQVEFDLLPTQYAVKDGKRYVAERGVKYVADFVFKENATGNWIIQDVKGMKQRRPEYIIKRKLMRYMNGLEVHEI